MQSLVIFLGKNVSNFEFVHSLNYLYLTKTASYCFIVYSMYNSIIITNRSSVTIFSA